MALFQNLELFIPENLTQISRVTDHIVTGVHNSLNKYLHRRFQLIYKIKCMNAVLKNFILSMKLTIHTTVLCYNIPSN